MRRTVKAWVVVNVLDNGRAWEGSTSATRGKSMKAFVGNTNVAWDEWRDMGWRAVRCVISYDDGRPAPKRRKAKGGKRV